MMNHRLDHFAQAEQAILAAEHGDLTGLASAMAAVGGDGSPESRALMLGLSAVRRSLDRGFLGSPRPGDAAGVSKASAPYQRIAMRACGRMVRLAALAFDVESAAKWGRVQESLEIVKAPQPWSFLCKAWTAMLGGRSAEALAHLERASEEVSRERDAAATVEATVLRALCEDDGGDLPAALETARRAARMAQTEACPELEYLAHLVLARLRRRSGRPHLAVHILSDLALHAPSAWHPFIAWELVIAGALDKAETLLNGLSAVDSPSSQSPAIVLVRAALDLLGAVKRADHALFRRAGDILREAPPWLALHLEIAALVALIGTDSEPAPGPVLAWSRGEDGGIPFGLDGLGMLSQHVALDDTVGLVFGRPDCPGRRILRSGASLLPAAQNLETTNDEDTGGARTETGLAVLVLAAPVPLSRADFFRAVYGFSFVPDRHRGILDVLVHRMRSRLGEAGILERDAKDGTLVVRLTKNVMVPDGRCTLAPVERLLRALAELGTTGTHQAAQRLNIPLRSVQRTLQELVADGSCEALRDGANVVYRIKDTTFTSVTSLDALRLIAETDPGFADD